jgi:hypothetical protein
MSLANYFDNVEGIGVLGTADAAGKVDLALYAKPQVLDEDTVVFVMEDGLSHDNLKSNPHAAYLFTEQAEGYNGLRMYLTTITEETDPRKIEAIRRRETHAEDFVPTEGFLVHFKVDEVRRLVGLTAAKAR